MTPTAVSSMLNLAEMELDAVVLFARYVPYEPAREEVRIRLWRELGDLYCLGAGRPQLAWEDREDFRQAVLERINRAIDRYDLEQVALPHGRSFRSFAFQVVLRDCQDFARKLRRRQKHEATADLDFDALPARTENHTLAEEAERHELIERVRAALARLDAPSRAFLERVMAGVKLPALAEELGKPYWAVRRKLKKLGARLARELGMPLPERRRRKRKGS